jgi:hypothetical protein
MDTAVLERRVIQKTWSRTQTVTPEKKKTYEEACAECNAVSVETFIDELRKRVKFSPRQGWAEAAKEFVESGNEEIFFPDVFDDEDLSWWQWEQK